MLIKSSKLVFPLPSWLNPVSIFALSILFCITIVSCSSEAGDELYRHHCGSIVPGATPADHEFVTPPFDPNQYVYYTGGDEFLTQQNSSEYFYSSRDRKVFLLRTEEVYRTEGDDIYKVKATLIFQTQDYVTYYVRDVQYSSSQSGSHEFELQGFWSTASGKLCMVGSTIATSSQGQKKTQSSDVVLKLSDVKRSSDITSLIRGTLESLSSADVSTYFKPISLLIFPMAGYNYTKVSKDFNYGCPGQVDVPTSNSLRLTLDNPICSVVHDSLMLEYNSTCKHSNSCSPFGEGLGYLPQVMFLRTIQCSEDKQSLRFLVEFSNSTYFDYYSQSFDPNRTLVAEGSWDPKKNQLCGVACRMSDSGNSFDSLSIGDCSTRLSLRFPATWSVESTTAIIGSIWTNKKASDSGYFDQIKFTSSQRNSYYRLRGVKYHYSLVERAAQVCQKRKPNGKKGMQYPEGTGNEMQFSLSLKKSQGKRDWWGHSVPVSVGDQLWNSDSMGTSISRVGDSSAKAKTVPSKPFNISYQMSFDYYNENSTFRNQMKITAEGTYDPATGSLCMIGCKYLAQDVPASTNESRDCKILVNIQFPPTKSNKHIEVQIESTREKSSSLHFETLLFSGVPYYSHGETMWRMDFEIIMTLIANTLACIFVGYQILYLKKHHNVIPSISLVMLVILTLGQMIPLMLNFEALFFSKHRRYGGGYGWVEMDEVFVRVITMVAFLLHFRLLQVAFSARVASENQKISWTAEKKTLYWALPLYIAGGLLGFLVNWKKYGFGEEMYSRRRFYANNRSFWQDSRSYSGLILDVFLFPQILLNIFLNSRGKPLSEIFYLGTTLVRLFPHAYDLYRARHFVQDYRWSYMYAAPGADFYSTAWDVIILLVGMLFASLIFLQQRFGGRSFLPKRLKAMGEYEKVPMTIDA